MPLRQEFTDAIRRAEEERLSKLDRKPFLHQAIAGPAQSGKTYLADQYIAELIRRKLVEDKRIYYNFPGHFMHDIYKKVEEAKGGLLIIDDMNHCGSREMEQGVDAGIRHAVVKNECTLILIGTYGYLQRYAEDPALGPRMNKMVVITEEAPTALPHDIIARKPLALRGKKEPVQS